MLTVGEQIQQNLLESCRVDQQQRGYIGIHEPTSGQTLTVRLSSEKNMVLVKRLAGSIKSRWAAVR